MIGSSFWRTAAKLAWRDIVGGPRLAILTACAVAVSVAATCGVAGISAALQKSLSGDLRTWLGGDVSVVTFDPPTRAQTGMIETLERKGIDSTMVITAPANATSGRAPDPVGLLVKFIDPAKYPLYGSVELDHGGLPEVLTGQTAVLSGSAAEALQVRIGDEIRISGEPFRVASIVRREPDPLAGTPPLLGPHAILTLGALARVGIGRTAFLHYRILFRIPYGADVPSVRKIVDGAFPDAEVLDYREPSQQASDVLKTTLRFLQAMAGLAVLFGALGAAIAMRIHLSRKLDFIAVLRTLGARRSQILTVILLQAGLIAVAGSMAGIGIAIVIQWRIATSLSELIPLANHWLYEPRAVFAGAALALAAVTCTIVPQIFAACRSKPAVLLRRTPRARSRMLVAALSTGIVVIVFAAAGRESIAPEIVRQLPAPDSGVAVIGALPSVQPLVARFLKTQPGVEGQVRTLTVAWLQLQAVDGRPIDAEYVNRMWVTTCEPDLPSTGSDALRMDREIARRLGAHLGSRVEFRGSGRTITAHIAELPERRPIERIWYGLTFDCAVLAGQNTAHHIYAKVEPAQVAAVVRSLHAEFPKLPVGRIQDLFAYFGDAGKRAAEVTRVMAVVVALAVALLLLAVIAIWHGSFRREIAIYKILGARRNKLIALISGELSMAGLLAACIGAPLGCAAASLVLSTLLQRPVLAFHWIPIAASIPAAVAVANVGGWLISFGLLNTKPLDVLRERG